MAVVKIRNAADTAWITVGGGVEIAQQDAAPATTYPGQLWLDTDAVHSSTGIADADGDTLVQCEESADEDIVRIDAGGSEIWRGISTGEIVKPLQPVFLAYMSTNHTIGALDTYEILAFDTELYDLGGDYNTGNGIFTAPVDGIYLLGFSLRLDIDTAAGHYQFNMQTTNCNDYNLHDCKWTTDPSYENFHKSFIIQLDASDQAYVRIKQQLGTLSTFASGSSYSKFYGYLLG